MLRVFITGACVWFGLALLHAPARAAEVTLTVDQLANLVNTQIPAKEQARLTDVSDTEGQGLEVPTQVYAGGATLDIDGELAPADALFYVQDGTIRGVELIYVPDEGEFADFSFAQQQHSFDMVYGHIADNYAGDEGGKTLLYDETGGLYQYRDPQGVVWTLSWVTGLELTLSFDSEEFEPMHSALTLVRAANFLEGGDAQ